MRLFGALCLSLIAAVLVMSAVIVAAPGETADRLVWAGLLFPLIWPGFIFYCYWSERGTRAIAVLAMASIVSAGLIVLS